MKKIIFFIFILIIFSNPSFAKKRYFLLDHNIHSINLELDNKIDENIKNIIIQRFNKNNINISESSDIKLLIKIIDIKSQEKKITISEFGEYDIIDNEIKALIKLEIYDKENNLIWTRKLSKLNSQKWLDFSRLKIGSNLVLQAFYVPTQFVIDLKRKYSEEEFINIAILDLVNSVLDNLIY